MEKLQNNANNLKELSKAIKNIGIPCKVSKHRFVLENMTCCSKVLHLSQWMLNSVHYVMFVYQTNNHSLFRLMMLIGSSIKTMLVLILF